MSDPSFIGFYAAIACCDLSAVELTVKKYTDMYIIACENSPNSHKATQGWHMHFLICGTETTYRNLINNLKIKYSLIGKTTKDNAHGYGRVRGELRNTERYITYILKDQQLEDDQDSTSTYPDLFRYGLFPLDYLIDLSHKSYPKLNKTDITEEIMMFIGAIQPQVIEENGILVSIDHPVTLAKDRIILYYQQNTDKAPARGRVTQLLLHYFIHYNKEALTIRQIADWFYA